ncbi:phage holin [Bifidobacterium sp. ESL0790]|uniref:phage holin n=1 Tax=Bifidobacterium sp. ESL0790 TaxID=2983233 RepID=UPI0023FA171C|nr:phage holin [Bifidobacterium sp. ESL0790]WEV72164.1 hypothetical protein OZY47_06905 [Bifidobacterium sp. ESL0790]
MEEKPRHAFNSPGLERLATTNVETEASTPATPALETPDGTMPAWLLPDKVYDVLYWIVTTVLPDLAILVASIGYGVHWQPTSVVVLVISAVDAFLGGIMGISKLHAKLKAKSNSS